MDMEEKKLTVDAAEQALPVQELPADIPAEVRQKLAEDLNLSLIHIYFRRGICYNNRTITNTRGGVASAGCRRRSKSTQWPVVSVWLALICSSDITMKKMTVSSLF